MKEKRNIRKRLLSLLLTALMLVSVMIQPVTVMAVEPAGVRTESAETEKSGEPGETEPDADQPAEEAYAVTGRVTCGDRPAAGVQVSLLESPEKMAATDENGEYTLENVPPGKYSLTAEKEGFTFENPVSVTVEHQPVQVQAVEMGLAVPEITCKGDFMVDGSVTYEVSTPVEGAEYNWSFSGAFSDQTARQPRELPSQCPFYSRESLRLLLKLLMEQPARPTSRMRLTVRWFRSKILR